MSINYSKLTTAALQDVMSNNPPDTPHYLKAKDELSLRGFNYEPYPKWLFHPDKPEGKIFTSFEDAKGPKGKGWVGSPAKLQKSPSAIVAILEKQVQPWWSRWNWAFIALGVILGLLVAIKTLIKP